MHNPFFDFYGKHNISPVHQDINDFKRHLMRREKLYRSLGMPPALFKNKRVLEIGPGGGYNALVLFNWGARVDFIEPNPKAREELPVLFKEYGIKRKNWNLFPCKIEDFVNGGKYDVVIAEGFIPGLYHRKRVIARISSLVDKGGVAVVTCIDDISFFFELLKRILAHRYLQKQKVEGFDEQVEVLADIFLPQLKSLKFTSRPVKDWVMDNFFNPFSYGNFFSIADCLREFGEKFVFLGSSPDLFTDYSWYKDTGFNCRQSLLGQFYRKRHMLLYYKLLRENQMSERFNKELAGLAFDFRRLAAKVENNLNPENISRIIKLLKEITKLTNSIDKGITQAINEGIGLLGDYSLSAAKILNAKKLTSAFGRCQQYVSLVKGISNAN